MQLNQPVPDFELADLQGTSHSPRAYRGKIVIINFWSADCPHSERTDHYIVSLLESWNGEVELFSIAANRNESLQLLELVAVTRGLPRVLVDAEGLVADLYGAITTPHVFILDREGILRYQGAVDNITIRKREATYFFLQEAVEALLAGRLPAPAETPAYGCAIVREI